MSSPSEVSSLVALSDLHLSCGVDRNAGEPGESFFQDDALVELLSDMTESAECPQLLLLGDVFELPGGVIEGRRWRHCLELSVDQLRARLRRVALAHPAVFDALRQFVAAGGTIHVVPGNHDPALNVPEVFAELRSLLAAGQRGNVELHRGVFRIADVLHAEHGNRLHDINAFVVLDAPYSMGETEGIIRLEDPIGSALHRARERGPSAKSIVASTWDLINAGLWGVRHRGASVSGNDPALCAVASSVDIGMVPALRRLARRYMNRGGARRDSYMLEGVLRTHAALARGQLDAPLYLFGHSHRSTDETVGDGSVRYINTGSWSQWGDHLGTGFLPFVLIEWGDGVPRAELRSWPVSGSVDHQLRRIGSLA